jgi:NAD(P)-dependent dehydrogenase (short-subunit alcohol dehydrogenase family)
MASIAARLDSAGTCIRRNRQGRRHHPDERPAGESAPGGVTVSSIASGVIDTPFASRLITQFVIREILSNVSVGCVGTADVVAKIITFLVSDESSYIVGQTIDVDGGWFLP